MKPKTCIFELVHLSENYHLKAYNILKAENSNFVCTTYLWVIVVGTFTLALYCTYNKFPYIVSVL